MNIDEMPAGSILDALVAERVMGWKNDPQGGWLCYSDKEERWVWTGWLSSDPHFEKDLDTGHEYQSPFDIIGTKRFSPSTDIVATWVVVERFHQGDSGEGYNVQLDGHGGGFTFHIFKDATCYNGDALYAPLAICRAALKAMQP